MGTTANMAEAACGNCSKVAAPGVLFCSGCGQPLWQKCPDCRSDVLLAQQFCNGCGTNLKVYFEKQLTDCTNLLDRCAKIGEEGNYAQAKRLASMYLKPQDYRFQQIAERAAAVTAECDKQQQYWEEELLKVERRAKRYAEADRVADVVKVLETVPAGVLTEELTKLLASSKQTVASLSSCKRDLKKALAEKRYNDAVGLLSQIVDMNPSNEKYKKQLTEVAAKLRAKAEKLGSSGQFAKAVQMLQSLPANFKDEEVLENFNSYEEAVYLRLMLAKATYYSPLIPGVLERLEKLTSEDDKTIALKKRISDCRKKSKSLFTEYSPEWMKPEAGVLGVPIIPSKIPPAFPGTQPECITSRGSQFFVALGLALQAVQTPMPKGDLIGKEVPKGLLAKLFGKKADSQEFGWGVDIGDSSLKAIRMRYTADVGKAQIDNAIQIPIESKAGQSKLKRLDNEPIVAALKKFATDFSVGEEPVLFNFPGNELITRFVLLPPTADKKKYEDFVLQDGRANMPMPMDMVATALHVSDGGDNDRIAPSGILVAAKKVDIEARKSMIESAGLKMTGVMPEPFALWNALQAVRQVELENNIQVGQAGDSGDPGRMSYADMLIDIGHQRTNLLIAHPKGLWFRTIDWGLSDLTHALCSALKLTYGEADKMRREPLRAKHLQIPMDAMLAACQVPRRELERSAYVARESIGELRLSRVMLVGGGVFQPFLSSWLNGCPF